MDYKPDIQEENRPTVHELSQFIAQLTLQKLQSQKEKPPKQ